MQPRTQLIALSGILLFGLIIIELVRRRRLRVGYSLIWLITGVAGFALFASQDLLNWLGQLAGVSRPISMLLSAGIAFIVFILLGNSITLTILWRQDKAIAQQQALTEFKLRELESKLAALESHPRRGQTANPGML